MAKPNKKNVGVVAPVTGTDDPVAELAAVEATAILLVLGVADAVVVPPVPALLTVNVEVMVSVFPLVGCPLTVI